MWLLTPPMVLFTIFLWFVAAQEKLTGNQILIYSGITIITFGLLVYTISPKRGWWGPRLVTFSIFVAYLSYLISEFVYTDHPFDPTVHHGAQSPFNALLGFFIFGIPSLLYTFSGKTERFTDETEGGFDNPAGTFANRLSKMAKYSSLVLSIISVILVLIKWFMK